MKNIQYLDILKKAFAITWENKFLWFFGFAIFLGSVVMNVHINKDELLKQGNILQEVTTFSQKHPVAVAVLGIIFVLVMIVLFFLRLLANVAIIKAINDINLYKQLSFFKSLKQAVNYLKRILLLEILTSLSLIVLIVVLAIPSIYLFALGSKILAIILAIFACMIILPLVILAYYLRKFSYYYITLGDFDLRISIESAYSLLEQNIKESLLIGVVMIGVEILFFATFLVACIMLGAIFALIGLAMYLIFAKMGAIIIVTIGIILAIIISAVLFSWYESFLQTVWLLFFQQIAFVKDKKKKIVKERIVEGEIPSPEVI